MLFCYYNTRSLLLPDNRFVVVGCHTTQNYETRTVVSSPRPRAPCLRPRVYPSCDRPVHTSRITPRTPATPPERAGDAQRFTCHSCTASTPPRRRPCTTRRRADSRPHETLGGRTRRAAGPTPVAGGDAVSRFFPRDAPCA